MESVSNKVWKYSDLESTETVTTMHLKYKEIQCLEIFCLGEKIQLSVEKWKTELANKHIPKILVEVVYGHFV